MKKPTKTTKKVKGFACLWGLGEETPRFTSVGNGEQFQYPIFPNLKEARDYKNGNYGIKKIIKVVITYSLDK